MKVLRSGWSKKVTCTGHGSGAPGCHSRLLVGKGDLFKSCSMGHQAHGKVEWYVSIRCPECGRTTDLGRLDDPGVATPEIRANLLPVRAWEAHQGVKGEAPARPPREASCPPEIAALFVVARGEIEAAYSAAQFRDVTSALDRLHTGVMDAIDRIPTVPDLVATTVQCGSIFACDDGACAYAASRTGQPRERIAPIEVPVSANDRHPSLRVAVHGIPPDDTQADLFNALREHTEALRAARVAPAPPPETRTPAGDRLRDAVREIDRAYLHDDDAQYRELVAAAEAYDALPAADSTGGVPPDCESVNRAALDELCEAAGMAATAIRSIGYVGSRHDIREAAARIDRALQALDTPAPEAR